MVENSIEVLQKTKSRTTISSSHPTSGYVSKGTENRISKRYLHTHVHYSIIYNSQDVEAPYLPIKE